MGLFRPCPGTSRRAAGAVLLAALAGCVARAGDAGDEPTASQSQAAGVCASGTVVKGIDVSVYQGAVSWPAVKAAGMDFAIARISDGSALDTQFSANWSGMKSAGLVRGAYQYFEPGEDPAAQAGVVVSAVGALGDGDLPVTADMETTGGQTAATIVAKLQTWIVAVKAGTGKTPMIYTAEGYWDGSAGGSGAFASSPLWVANWGVTCPSLPAGWTNWTFWQDDDQGSVAGISPVDTDVFDGTLAQLEQFAGGTSPADGGPSGIYAATYVTQSWPLASVTWQLAPCETVASSITLKNTGTLPWDTSTRLATTQPRDRKSQFGDATWIAADRPAQVSGSVPPGGTFEFQFDFHAPPTPGAFVEYFGLVEDGAAWFGDPGQGGPPDDRIAANIEVTGPAGHCAVDPGVPDGGPAAGDAGPAPGDGGAAGDGGERAGAGDGGATIGGRGPAEGGAVVVLDAEPPGGGCGCAVPRKASSPGARWVGVAAIALSVRRRRRAPGDARTHELAR
jgi:lysozyme